MLAAVRLVEPLVINNSAQLVLLIVAVLVVVLVGQCWCYCASVLVAVLRCAFLGSALWVEFNATLGNRSACCIWIHIVVLSRLCCSW